MGITAALLQIQLPVQSANAAPRHPEADEAPQHIIVELGALPPTVVAADKARRGGLPFDRRAHERAIAHLQEAFLAALRTRGIAYSITETTLGVASGEVLRPNRFDFLLNAIGLDVPTSAFETIRAIPGVERVSRDEPVELHLDKSVPYLRASDGPGNKTIFTQGEGSPSRFDGTGQVIAVLDTGIDHTHPAFDTRFPDSQFLNRTGDVRPVRAGGAPYIEGTHHPKIVYFMSLTAAGGEDDYGHGTHVSADAAGLKVQGPGPDGLAGNSDDQVIEGVAPGALIMSYKVCDAAGTCANTTGVITALEDSVAPTDIADNPKPVATVINMSFGNPTVTAEAAGNAVLAGAVAEASAGNSGPQENTIGIGLAAGRRVISTAATNDPGLADFQDLDVLVPDDSRYSTASGTSTGAKNDAGRSVADDDRLIEAILAVGAPQVAFPLGQHYVWVGQADTPDDIPDEVSGRIALIDAAGLLFAQKAANVAQKGAAAGIVMNNTDDDLQMSAPSSIPFFGVNRSAGRYLRDTLGFRSPDFDRRDPATWGTISEFPLRIDLPAFEPHTAGFSSRGPAGSFGVLKPDVTAPGSEIYSATVTAGQMADPSRFISVNGTSFSGPQVSGAAALVRQAILQARGAAPIAAEELRSGAGAAAQGTQNALVPPSIVRGALTNTATNLRQSNGETPIPDDDDRNLIHDIGSGLIHVKEAVDSRAVLGTNNLNGLGGPDDAGNPDFLPTHSFGENTVINTCNPNQSKNITITLQNISGASGAGTYALSLLDGGAFRGNLTRPIADTAGFEINLSQSFVELGGAVDNNTTFDMTVVVNGHPGLGGLGIAAPDQEATTTRTVPTTEFLWWVVAQGSNGELLRMPFYYRALEGECPPPSQNQISDDASPDQSGGLDNDGNYKLSWDFPGGSTEPFCGFQVEEATSITTEFEDAASEALVRGSNSVWSGDDEWISMEHPDTGGLSYAVEYLDNQQISLTMRNPILLPGGRSSHLIFDSFEDIETDFDFGFVEVGAAGQSFQSLAAYTGSFSGKRLVDLSKYAGQSIGVRFRFITDSAVTADGWFIDNVEIRTGAFTTIGIVSASTLEFDVTNRARGTYYYWIAGLFGTCATEVGPHSNIEQISVANHVPVAEDDTAVTAEDNPVKVSVLANDSDADGDSLTITGVTQGAHGSVAVNGDGTITYSPSSNFNGTDGFTYTVGDGFGGSDSASVTVSVTPVNDAPLAIDDSALVRHDTTTRIDVLANDTDVDGDSLGVSAVTQGAHGSVSNNDDHVIYTPSAGFAGTDSFTYTATDNKGGTDTATVFVDVDCGGLVTDFMAYSPLFSGGVFVAVGDLDGDGCDEIITGAGLGGGPHVRIFRSDGLLLSEFMAYDGGFSGGVRVATADVNADGDDELITAPGPGGGPHVRVLDWSGSGLAEIASFMAFDPGFSGGVFVAGGNLIGSSADEIVAAADQGGGPHVKVFSGPGAEIAGLMVYDPSFGGGVRVASANLDSDSFDELVTGAGPGGGPHVRVLNLSPGGFSELLSFMAYSPSFTEGIYVAGGDATSSDPGDEIATGAGEGGGPHVRLFSGETSSILLEFMAYDPSFTGGVRVAVGDPDGDGAGELLTGPGPGGGPHVRVI